MNIKQTLNKAVRSSRDRWIAGVCAGFAEATETPPWIWRAGMLFLSVFFFSGVLLYIILWMLMPEGDQVR
jgi:phage shock protein PspC (stress-responsive transcriptional regulator)